MKNIKIVSIFLVLILGITWGCDDEFLTQIDPNNSTPESYFTTVQSLNESIIASYATQAIEAAFNRRAYWLGDFTADDVESRDLSFAWEAYTYGATSDDIFRAWRGFYMVINRANQAIVYAPDIEAQNATEEALKTKIVAEARFLRSLYHYYLTMWWGDVPFKTEENLFDPFSPTTPRSEILSNIVADLLLAIPDLPTKASQPSDDQGRATQGAARTLLARVYMVQENWSEAESTCTDIINGGYSLLPELADIHEPTNAFNDESIYEIVFTYTGGGNHDWNLVVSGGNSATNKSPFRSYWVYNPLRDGDGAKATDKLINSYDAADPRLVDYFYGPTTIEGGVPYDFAARGWSFKKCMPKDYYTYENIDQRNSGDNFLMFRLADVILMRAEARVMQNNISGALTDLNTIRARAREGDAGILPDITDIGQAGVLQAIKDERFRELCAEVVRIIDIKRWGDFDELPGGFTANRDELLPLPANEISNNPQISQNNPGW